MRITGTYQQLGNTRYFIPTPLPPRDPDFLLNEEIMILFGEASFELGRLREMGSRLPDIERFLKAYVTKEALFSSEIEGIHTTLIEAFTHPLGESKPDKDTQLVLNYTQALDTTLDMISKEGFPIVSRVFLKAHKILLSGGENEKSAPGTYRGQAVRIGNLIPPPPQEISRLISELEQYINAPSQLPDLIRAGLSHAHFEMIHPFLDGNGRVGRLLIVLMLVQSKLLNKPILYPSYYLKKHQAEYYQKLDHIRTRGDYEGWITYYLKVIRDSARDACLRAQAIESLKHDLQKTIDESAHFAQVRKVATATLNVLLMYPVISIPELSKQLGKAYNTASNILERFEQCSFVHEIDSSRERNKLYQFTPYFEVLNEEYDHLQ